jgi:hypothetical protein
MCVAHSDVTPPIDLLDQVLHLEQKEDVSSVCRGKLPTGDDIVNMERFKADKVVDPSLIVRQGCKDGFALTLARSNEPVQVGKLKKDVFDALHERCPILDQAVRSRACRAGDVPRDGKDLSPLFQCEAGGDQGPTPLWGFDHDHPAGDAGDDAVPLGKGPLGRVGIEWILAHHRPATTDLIEQPLVARRIEVEESRAENGDGPSLGVERAAVCSRIDPDR